MSHELTIRADQTAEMAYLGEVPWHGLGQQLADGADIETWIRAAGMDWRILRSKVRYFAERDGSTQLEVPDSHVLFRSDTKAPLGLVSSKYKSVQPGQILGFFRDLVDGAGFKLETAGTLFGGRKFWALASIGESANILPGDKIKGHLLVATSCDGSSKTTGRYVATRVVCNNTMRVAMGEKGNSVDISHRTAFDPDHIKDSLGIIHGQFGEYIEAARSLAEVKLTNDRAESFVRNLLRPAEVAQPEVSFSDLLQRPFIPADTPETAQRAPKGEAEILRLFAGAAIGDRIPGVHGTAWGMLNAVTEYVDHRTTAKTDSHRLNSAWFNGGDDLKTSAFEQLLAMR